MAKMIKFDLPIDGVKVATLEDLQEHFTIEIVGHFRAGLLARWLRSQGMTRELAAVEGLTARDDAGVLRDLCLIFEVEADDDAIEAALIEATGIPGIRPGKDNTGRDGARSPGDTFCDGPAFPELVVVPSGRFMMGQLDEREGGQEIRIGYSLAVGAYPVTFDEWDACVSEGGCGGYRPEDRGWGRGNRPVINVNWEDAKMYAWWLSWKTGKGYRLLSESEWEYCARGGTRTWYCWGDDIGRDRANCLGSGAAWNHQTSPVGSFSPNAFGLYDMHGNVNEWVEDHWNHSRYLINRRGSRSPGPADGGVMRGSDYRRVVRGGSWKHAPMSVRAGSRKGRDPDKRSDTVGFRVARTLTP